MKNSLILESNEIFSFQINKDILFSDSPKSKITKNNILANNKIFIGTSQKELNSTGYRSDEFIYEHKFSHIIFSGCSYTWGSGINKNDVWSKKVYDLISKNQNCSGYFNLGVPGSSMLNQIADIFKYCKTYGNPNVIFLNIPDPRRFYIYNKTLDIFHDGNYEVESLNIIKILNFQYYFLLDQYCNSNNIQLYCFSWNNQPKLFDKNNDKIINNFKNFYRLNIKENASHVFDYKSNNKGDVHADTAADGMHLGTAHHDYWANFIYKKYKEYNDYSWD
jgi:hypothetical protein